MDRAIGREGFKIVLLLRLSPVFPFNLLNYSLGLTKVRFADYVLASIGMLPGSLLYTWSGVVVGDVIRLAGGGGPERGPAYYTVVVLGLAATVAVTALVTRTARRALWAKQRRPDTLGWLHAAFPPDRISPAVASDSSRFRPIELPEISCCV